MTPADINNNSSTATTGIQCALAQEVESTLLPILEKLKNSNLDADQSARLIAVLESKIELLVKTYGSLNSLAATYQRLSPTETQVASLVKQGLPTKDIAAALSISPGTVNIHRKHIRKKLKLDYKGINLRSYLQSLS